MTLLSNVVMLVCVVLYNLFDQGYAAHILSHSSTTMHMNQSTANIPVQAVTTLGQIKLGLGAAFFFSVLLACGLPIILIDWLQKKGQNQTICSLNHGHSSTSAPAINPSNVIRTDSDPDSPSKLIHQRRRTDWSTSCGPGQRQQKYQQETVPEHKISITSESRSSPNQSPNFADAEHTDLLTGAVVPVSSGWSHVRRSHNPGSSETRLNGRSSIRRLRSCREAFGNLQSSTSRRLILRRWFSRLNCFAAGIFLSSGFMELYVDVEESIEEAKSSLNMTSEFPFAPFLTLVGFFLVLSVEQIIWAVRSAKHDCQPTRPSITSTADTFIPSPYANGGITHMDKSNELIESPQTATSPLNTGTHFTFTDDLVMPPVNTSAVSPPDDLFGSTPPSRRSSKVMPSPNRNPQHNQRNRNHMHESHHDHHLPNVDSLTSFGALLQVIVLLCAMSVHALFEGLAVGLQSTVQHTLSLFSAILLHKLIIAAGIGLNLATATTSDSGDPNQQSTERAPVVSRRIMAYQLLASLIFAGSSPLGVLIGWALVHEAQQSGTLLMSTAILQGLACGTFFFVVFCELLPTEFRDGVGDRLAKLLFLILGFVTVAVYSFFMPH